MSELGPEARALFKLGREMARASEADRARSLAALRARLGDAAFDPTSAPNAVTGRAASSKLAGLLGASGAAVGLIVTAWLVLRTPAPAHDAVTPKLATPSATASVAPLPIVSETVEAAAAPPPSVAASALPPAPSSAQSRGKSERLAEEVALLARAAADLNSGRNAEALRELDQHRRLFPNGQLTQERRAARARALCALGRREEAKGELLRMAQHGSPDVARTRQLCGFDAEP
jgi:hypothetical protein